MVKINKKILNKYRFIKFHDKFNFDHREGMGTLEYWPIMPSVMGVRNIETIWAYWSNERPPFVILVMDVG